MNTENRYIETDLGNVSPNPRGEYDAEASYEYLDLVTLDGGSFLCLAALGEKVKGISPTPEKNTETWQYVAFPGTATEEYQTMYDLTRQWTEQTRQNASTALEAKLAAAQSETGAAVSREAAAASEQKAAAQRESAAGYADAAQKAMERAVTAQESVEETNATFPNRVQEAVEEADAHITDTRQNALNAVVHQQEASIAEVKEQTREYINEQKESAKQEVQEIVGSFDADVNEIIRQVQDAGNEQVAAVTAKGDEKVVEIGSVGAAQVAAVNEAGTVQKQAVSTEGERQLSEIINVGVVQKEAVNAAGEDQIAAIEAAGAAQAERIETAGDAKNAEIETAGAAQIWAVNEAGAGRLAEINMAGEDAVDEISLEAIRQLNAIQQEGNTQVSTINSVGNTQVAAVNAAGESRQEAIENEGAAQVSVIAAEGERQVAVVNAAGSAQEKAVNDAGATQKALVEAAGTEQAQKVNEAGETQTAAISAEGNAQVAAVTAKGEEQTASINIAGAAQKEAVESTGNVQTAAVTAEGEAQLTAIETAGTELLNAVNEAGAAQAASIREVGTEQTKAVNAAGDAKVNAIETAGTAQITAITEKGTEQVSAVNDEGTTQLSAVKTAGETWEAAVNEAGEGQKSAVEAAGEENVAAVNDAGDAKLQEINDVLEDALTASIEAYYAMRRTGKVYQTKIWKFATNPTSAGEKLFDNAGLVFEPSTDTTEGQDDYADIPLFQWIDVNYIREDDGSPRPVAIEGMDGYKTSGAVDVGAMQMSFWWKWDASNEEYDLITISDKPHPELGLEPWVECVKADGTVLPWCIASKYFSGIASDGLLRSQPGLALANYQSYDNMLVNYQKKGSGYWGAGASRNLFQIIFNLIKGATKSSQTLFTGCVSYNWQYGASVERTEKETYFPITNAQAANVIVGSRVCVGYGANNNGAISLDRGTSNIRAYADMVKVLRIEALDENNSAVYLDTEEGFDTVPVELTDDLSAPITMSSMCWHSGETDKVIGRHDGSPVSNTSGKYPYRVQGREYAPGVYAIASDIVMDFQTDYSKNVYVAEKGTSHSSNDAVIRSAYKMIGNIPACSDGNGSDWWIGDISVDVATGSWYPSVEGASDKQGYGDRLWAGGAQTAGTREFLQGGDLGGGSHAGSACLLCGGGRGSAHWAFGCCD